MGEAVSLVTARQARRGVKLGGEGEDASNGAKRRGHAKTCPPPTSAPAPLPVHGGRSWQNSSTRQDESEVLRALSFIKPLLRRRDAASRDREGHMCAAAKS